LLPALKHELPRAVDLLAGGAHLIVRKPRIDKDVKALRMPCHLDLRLAVEPLQA